MTPLAQVFSKHAQAPVALPGDPEQLEALLAAKYAAARDAWPGVELPADELVRYLAERLPKSAEGRSLALVLEEVALFDLYLACACAAGVPAAAQALERSFLAKLPGLLRNQFREVPTATLEDACQVVREQLLLGNQEGGPYIRNYSGKGGLLNWIKVIAVRRVIKMLPQGDTEEREPRIFDDQAAASDPDKDLSRNDFQPKFRAAVRDAVMTATTQEQRYQLKLHYIQRLSTVKLAKLFGTNQPTMWRRLERIRQAILVEATRLLRVRHGISSEELKAFITDQSRLAVTLTSIFDDGATPLPVPNPFLPDGQEPSQTGD